MKEADADPESLKERGNKAFAAKEYKEAIDYYTKAINLDPSNHVFFSNRSASHAGLENWKEASDDAKECIRLDPTFVKGYYRLAIAQLEQKKYDDAEAALRQGLQVDANNPQLLKLMRTVKQNKKAPYDVGAVALNSSRSTPAASLPSSTTVPLDPATAQELQELRLQHQQTTQEYGVVQANLVKTQREHKINELTLSEIRDLVPESKCYRCVGKMFLASSKAATEEYLEKQSQEQAKKEEEMTQKLEYLDRRIKSQRQNMEELIVSSRSATTSE